jgi:cobalt-precorrin-5B (C1)-methyltransferase
MTADHRSSPPSDATATPRPALRYGFTTGACATAATRAAYSALLGFGFPDPVTIRLPRGEMADFALAEKGWTGDAAVAAVIKDAGDDPDVTHGCLVRATIRRGPPGSGVRFVAGPGVGTVTLPGLPVPPGEPAINPVPRRMMTEAVTELALKAGVRADVVIEIAIPGGEEIAKHTLNPRLGIVGGLSILGTTGIVVPYSCSAWIHSIHRGIDVARAMGLTHLAGATGSTSEQAVRDRYRLPELALIDMGDFVGATLKYLRRHPVPRFTIAGGFGKLVKLAQGAMDLHSARSQVDMPGLAALVARAGGDAALVRQAAAAPSAGRVLQLCREAGVPVGDVVASAAQNLAQTVVGEAVRVDVLIVDRVGEIVGVAE